MSRLGKLPPRCPIPKELSLNPVSDTYYSSSSSPIESYIGQYKSSSQDSTLEDKPAWLDELLCEITDGIMMVTKGGPLRRSASDSVVLLSDLSDNFSGYNQSDDDDDDESSLTSDACGELESASFYGPNSPRARNNAGFFDNPIASVFSDFVSQKFPQNLEDTVKGNINFSPVAENVCCSMGIQNAKRNPGHWSRVRKLQHIADLESTTVETDLSVRVASLLQTRATLSLENSQFKQEMAILKQDKLIREGEYQLLKNEAQRL